MAHALAPRTGGHRGNRRRAPSPPAFAVVACALAFTLAAAAQSAPDLAARGFRRLWNGTDLQGWHGQRHFDPHELAVMDREAREKMLADDEATIRRHWRVADGAIVNDGEGAYLTTDAVFGDAEYVIEYRTVANADSGVYLRGCPQVQIWDFTEAGGKAHLGADKGSGALWNNQVHPNLPLVLADRPFGEWNRLEIRQIGERTWVRLNGQVTVLGVVMENYWNRKAPLPPRGPLQLQTHGGEIRFRELWVRDLGADEANAVLRVLGGEEFEPIFDGKTLDGWQGDLDAFEVAGGAIRCRPGVVGNLFTRAIYTDFIVRLQFRLPPGGNSGLAVRYPGVGDAAYVGCEVQVLDDSAKKHATLEPWQYHGSIYGLVAAHRGYLRAVGEWNLQEVVVRGGRIAVTLNGTTIVDADVLSSRPLSGKPHPGAARSDGFFGFCGHGDPVEFRDVRIRELAPRK